jgi:hypothetical protein
MTRRYSTPRPLYRKDNRNPVARLLRGAALVVAAGLIVWTMDSLFWGNRIREEIATALEV